MKAREIMVSPVITVRPNSSVKDLAKLLVEHRISAVPVVDDSGSIVGMASEGDLIHRSEAGTERRRSWWLHLIVGDDALAGDYVRAHAMKVSDIMTRKLVATGPDTPLGEIAAMIEKHRIKRVPIVENQQLVGIVSRADLVRAVAGARGSLDASPSDQAIRQRLLEHLHAQPWAHIDLLNVDVTDGVVTLGGMVDSETSRKAIRVAAESMPGVREIDDRMILRPAG